MNYIHMNKVRKQSFPNCHRSVTVTSPNGSESLQTILKVLMPFPRVQTPTVLFPVEELWWGAGFLRVSSKMIVQNRSGKHNSLNIIRGCIYRMIENLKPRSRFPKGVFLMFLTQTPYKRQWFPTFFPSVAPDQCKIISVALFSECHLFRFSCSCFE